MACIPSAAHKGSRSWVRRIVLSNRQLSRSSSMISICAFTKDTLNQLTALLAFWPATGTRFMIMYHDLGDLRAFVIVMVHISVGHTGRMPRGDFCHESILLV